MALHAAPLVIPALARHTATVVFLHGLGDSGSGWEDAVNYWRRREQLNEVKFILPHAPSLAITANGGYRMPGWFDVKAFGGDLESKQKNEDVPGVLKTTEYVHSLIQKEIDNGIPGDRIVIGGFSQGGAISMFSGLTAKVKLAGILAMSSFLLLHTKLHTHVPQPELNKQTSIFMAHGSVDQVIPTALAKESFDELKRQGYNASLKIYPGMAHSASPQELDDVEAYLKEVIPPHDKDASGKTEL
ncbi:acyl-protein thioesterase-1-like protein [Xylariales sp. PMI_506]|nr:acyl-protein thioesterase-1-like protein [Xylariales sp. PMI_506]